MNGKTHTLRRGSKLPGSPFVLKYDLTARMGMNVTFCTQGHYDGTFAALKSIVSRYERDTSDRITDGRFMMGRPEAWIKKSMEGFGAYLQREVAMGDTGLSHGVFSIAPYVHDGGGRRYALMIQMGTLMFSGPSGYIETIHPSSYGRIRTIARVEHRAHLEQRDLVLKHHVQHAIASGLKEAGIIDYHVCALASHMAEFSRGFDRIMSGQYPVTRVDVEFPGLKPTFIWWENQRQKHGVL